MKSLLISATMLVATVAIAQGTPVNTTASESMAQKEAQTPQTGTKKVVKKAKKVQKSSKKGAMIESALAEKGTAVAMAKEPPMTLPTAKSSNSTSTSNSSVVGGVNQSSTTIEAAKPAEAKKWGAEAAFVAESDSKLAWQNAQQDMVGYASVKYNLDKVNSFAVRQYGSLTAVGQNSTAGSVSTGKAMNTMLVHNRKLGAVAGADEAATLLQTRLVLPTVDAAGYNIAALSTTLVLPYTLNPKWSTEFGIRFGTSFNTDMQRLNISMPVQYGQIAYSLTDTFQIFQQAGVTTGDITMTDKMKLNLSTGMAYVPAPWIYMDFSTNQEHGIGAAATAFNTYNVAETKYGATLMLIY